MSRFHFRNAASVRPSDVQDSDAFALKVVAVAGFANDWTAYRGPTNWSDAQVAEGGDKLLAEVAKALFYVLAVSGRRYRH